MALTCDGTDCGEIATEFYRFTCSCVELLVSSRDGTKRGLAESLSTAR